MESCNSRWPGNACLRRSALHELRTHRGSGCEQKYCSMELASLGQPGGGRPAADLSAGDSVSGLVAQESYVAVQKRAVAVNADHRSWQFWLVLLLAILFVGQSELNGSRDCKPLPEFACCYQSTSDDLPQISRRQR